MGARLQEIRRQRGMRAREAGRWAEVLAAAWLLAKGWRILGFRLKAPQGEIDLLARRGGVLAVVEVKTRPTLEESLSCVTPAQQERLRRAGAAIAARRPDLAGLFVRLDMVALAPGRRPRHIPDAWGRTGDQIPGARPRR
ncbi:MAG TPA: YraN family protein [Caulobacteraceae bacterium]|jgi:putative endonuclease|nr:YraN family protein [Caulobacteraceae bacterium]